MGGAATAIVKDASAPWYNPAGLGRVHAEGISASVSAYGAQAERTKAFFIDRDSMPVASANLSGWTTAIFPSSLGYVKPLDMGRGDGAFHHAIGVSIVVPDFDHHDANLSFIDNSLGFGLSAKERLLEQSLWILPGWGGCVRGSVCFGVSIAAVYHSSESTDDIYLNQNNTNTQDRSYKPRALTWQQSTSQIAAGVQAGLQLQVAPHWWLGLSVRSPVRSVRGSGTLLVLDSNFLDQGNSDVRRASDDALWTDYRLPLHFRLGAAYEGERFRMALDVTASPPQASYRPVLANGGADLIQPRYLSGDPIGGPIQVASAWRTDLVVNASLGAQYFVSKKVSIQGGLFTDFSGVPDEVIDDIHPHINRAGVTIGAARRRGRSTTYVAAIATGGIGHSYGVDLSDTPDPNYRPKAQAAALYFNLGASTDFEEHDADETAEPATGLPLYERWWFWTALGAVVAGAVAATTIGALRSPGVPASDLGSQAVRP